MPRKSRQPFYRHHKAHDCAVVTIDGKNHYLGSWQSPESHEKYARLAAMVRVQLLSGCRPQEVMALRPCDLRDAGDGTWHYRPATHKTEHLDRGRCIVLGPKALAVLRPFLERGPEVPCFRPAESVVWHLNGAGRTAGW